MRTKSPQPLTPRQTSPRGGEEWKIVFAFAIAAFLLVGCSGARPPKETSEREHRTLRLRHQIMFQSEGEAHVFEGYMIFDGENLLVRAFAGPGVDLFTVVRGKKNQCGTLHIEGLKDKMDIRAIGDDIARVYLGGCEKTGEGKSAKCAFGNEQLIETYDQAGRTVKREFPTAHGIGLTIIYEDLFELNNHFIANKVSLTWGTSSNHMIIKTVDSEIVEGLGPNVFDSC